MTRATVIGASIVVGLLLLDLALEVWQATDGVDGMRRREAERLRRHELSRRHGPYRR